MDKRKMSVLFSVRRDRIPLTILYITVWDFLGYAFVRESELNK